MGDTPVALFLFNRPDLTRRVFAAIRAARPRRLFLFADGPRPGRPDDDPKCAQARSAVRDVDWDCEVQTDFAATNLGVTKRLASGITRVFGQAEEAILLEDDCLPHPGFFNYCESMLAHYRDDERVMHVSGSSVAVSPRAVCGSYFFSTYPIVWGWATWRRAWRHYDPALASWPDPEFARHLRALFPDTEYQYWKGIFDGWATAGVWDLAWYYSCWRQSGLAVTPVVNAISNLGWGPEATHTTGASPLADRPAGDPGPIRHPAGVFPDRGYDKVFSDAIMGEAIRAAARRRVPPTAAVRARRALGRVARAAGFR